MTSMNFVSRSGSSVGMGTASWPLRELITNLAMRTSRVASSSSIRWLRTVQRCTHRPGLCIRA